MKLPSELEQEARREKVSDPQDRRVDRRMDGSIGTAWWFSQANKRDKRIGKHMNGHRAFKMERANGMVRRKLRVRTYFKKGITSLAYGLFSS